MPTRLYDAGCRDAHLDAGCRDQHYDAGGCCGCSPDDGPFGACCVITGAVCYNDLDLDRCLLLTGNASRFHEDERCSDLNCRKSGIGACCIPTPHDFWWGPGFLHNCQDGLSDATCQAMGGKFLGAFSECPINTTASALNLFCGGSNGPASLEECTAGEFFAHEALGYFIAVPSGQSPNPNLIPPLPGAGADPVAGQLFQMSQVGRCCYFPLGGGSPTCFVTSKEHCTSAVTCNGNSRDGAYRAVRRCGYAGDDRIGYVKTGDCFWAGPTSSCSARDYPQLQGSPPASQNTYCSYRKCCVVASGECRTKTVCSVPGEVSFDRGTSCDSQYEHCQNCCCLGCGDTAEYVRLTECNSMGGIWKPGVPCDGAGCP